MAAHILIIDDDPVVRHLLSAVLSAAGYTVKQAKSGAEALEAVSQALASGSLPALVFLDLQLVDMPGTEVLRRIRQDCPSRIAVAMLSASSEEEVRTSFPGLDMDYYLEKPFPPDKLLSLVKSILPSA